MHAEIVVLKDEQGKKANVELVNDLKDEIAAMKSEPNKNTSSRDE